MGTATEKTVRGGRIDLRNQAEVDVMSSVADVGMEVVHGCAHQVGKWSVQSHSQALWLAILGEEYGEVAKAINEIALSGRGSYDVSNLRDELIHCAAVAVSAVECLDRCGFLGS